MGTICIFLFPGFCPKLICVLSDKYSAYFRINNSKHFCGMNKRDLDYRIVLSYGCLPPPILDFLKVLFIFLFEVTVAVRREDRASSSIHWLTSQMSSLEGTGSHQSQESGASSRFPLGLQGPKHFGHLLFFPRLLVGSCVEVEQLAYELSPIWNARCCK